MCDAAVWQAIGENIVVPIMGGVMILVLAYFFLR